MDNKRLFQLPSVGNFNHQLNEILSKRQLAKCIVFFKILTQLNLRTTNLEGCCHLLCFLVLFWGGNTAFDFFFFLDGFFHFFSYCFFFLLFFFLFRNSLSCLFSPGSRSPSTSFNTSKAFVFVIRISTRVSVSTCTTRTVLIPEVSVQVGVTCMRAHKCFLAIIQWAWVCTSVVRKINAFNDKTQFWKSIFSISSC